MNDATTKTLGRLDISVPEQEFEAGKPGTISILIKNPFDIPIDIIEIVGPRSPQLKELVGKGEHGEPAKIGLLDAFSHALRKAVMPLYYEIQFGGVSVDFGQPRQVLTINAEKKF